ncbi:MAG TPA: hypothetical protein VFB12_27240 [Ktedonobacteraceae bacterium]|nr:hypothetical protein [Ktedonobacteraceae bacterium]
MTRKDSEKDSERPHYYSQFWLDVAAGRRTIGGPKPNEEGEAAEPEMPEPTPPRRSMRANDHEVGRERAAADGRAEHIVHPVAEPVRTPSDFIEPEPETEDLDLEPSNLEETDYEDAAIDDEGIPDVDLGTIDEDADADEEEEFYDEEEEEEEEEDDRSWGRGRKKTKPGRQTKQPPKKPIRRDRRGGY